MRTPSLGVWALIAALVGCQQPRTADTARGSAPGAAEAATARPDPVITPILPNGRGVDSDMDELAIPAELNTARAAAQHIAMKPPVADAAVRREIDLEAALYQAAYATNVGDFTRHFLLEPIPVDQLPPLSIGLREFRLRVLARMATLDGRFAWTTPIRSNPAAKEFFPGTGHLATRLRIRIDDRADGGRTIRGEIGDWTVDVGSSRQRFAATWDGSRWLIERDAVRLIR